MTAFEAETGFCSQQWFMEQDTLEFRVKSCFTVRVFSNFSSRNILESSLVWDFLHTREGVSSRRLVTEAVLLMSTPHAIIFIPFLPLLQVFGSLWPGASFTCFDTLVCRGPWNRDFSRKAYFIFLFELFLIFSCKYFVIFYL